MVGTTRHLLRPMPRPEGLPALDRLHATTALWRKGGLQASQPYVNQTTPTWHGALVQQT